MSKMYMVRAGSKSENFDEFKDSNIVAIGWNGLGDLSEVKNLETIKEMVENSFPRYKQQTINMTSGQIKRFLLDMQKGDYVITYNSNERIYFVGKITSEYYFDSSKDYGNIRRVDWIGCVSRDVLSTSTKNTLGSIATIFEIQANAVDEILGKINKPQEPEAVSEPESTTIDTLDYLKEDFEGKAHEFIKDRILSLDWDEMQELTAALIRSLGFKTKVSQKGPDRGKDIVASPDGLGLEEPRILVEVKHRKGMMGSQDIRSFLGVFRPGNKGIYVSTGGFTKDAWYEAERANYPITLIDADYLVDLIISNYDNFDTEGRALIPLRKLYWPMY